jgi:hypothetical protein
MLYIEVKKMRCVICNELFYIRRNILDLFNTKKEYVCNRCYKKYPIVLNYEAIQLDKYKCVIISMFKKRNRIEYNGFVKEYTKLFISNMERTGYHAIFLDHIYLSDDFLEIMDMYSKLLNSNLAILTFTVKE